MSDIAVVSSAFLSQLGGLVRLVRPRQWIKNGFVFAPLIFCGEFLNISAVTNTLMGALLFCLASSATYIVNDIADVESDRLHPWKSTRPLAAGIVPVWVALAFLAMLYGVLIWGLVLLPRVAPVIIAYIVLNLAYSFVLKHRPVVEIFVIASGFLLRVYAGALTLSVPVSGWMFVTTLCLSLYLVTVKRRQEIKQQGPNSRQVLKTYSVSLVDRYAEMSGTGALVFYGLFIMSAKPNLIVTVPLVLFGLFRYWYVIESLGGGESPTDALLTDWPLLSTVLVWVGVCCWVLWPGQG